MKFSAAFAVLAVLSVKTFVSAFPMPSMAEDFDLEMRDEFTDGEFDDMIARELLDYSDELEEIDARELDADEDFLYVRVPVYGMRLDPLKMAKNTGESRLQGVAQKIIDQKLRPAQPQVRIARPTFREAAKKVIQQNRRPNAVEIGRQTQNNFKNLQRKISTINAFKGRK